MTRNEVLETLEKLQDSVSYKYTHREEVNEALAIAQCDVRLAQQLVEITESDLNGEELNNAIYVVVASARKIGKAVLSADIRR